MAKIKVMMGSLTNPLRVSSINAGTKLNDFLEAKDIEYSSRIRVNGKAATRNTTLKNGDIILTVGDVSGGR